MTNGQSSSDFISSVTFNPNFILEEGTDIECTTTKEDGKTTVSCANLDSGYAGATYSLDITIETIQADQKWTYTSAYAVGTEVTIVGEKFNIISSTDDTVTMLAQYNLGTDYRQSETTNWVIFSDNSGWEYTPGPKEIDIQLYDGYAKTYVNNYVTYLKGETGDTTITGTLITLAELSDLGCTAPSDYAWSSAGWTCANSDYAEWLVNGQDWWTRSATSDYSDGVWGVFDGGSLHACGYIYDDFFGVRPVITISKSAI